MRAGSGFVVGFTSLLAIGPFLIGGVQSKPSDYDIARFVKDAVLKNLYGQVKLNNKGRGYQWAALLLFQKEDELKPGAYRFQRRNSNDINVITTDPPYTDKDKPYYPYPVQYSVNYLVARPNGGKEEKDEHSEVTLLNNADALWKNFKKGVGNQQPSITLLFSWFMPCDNKSRKGIEGCSTQIFKAFTQKPFTSVSRIVAFCLQSTSNKVVREAFIANMKSKGMRVVVVENCIHPNSKTASLYKGGLRRWLEVALEWRRHDDHPTTSVD